MVERGRAAARPQPHGWQHTFDTANQRVARAGLASVRATAHMLRHSFALRWFAGGRMLYERRFAHLDADEMRHCGFQFGFVCGGQGGNR